MNLKKNITFFLVRKKMNDKKEFLSEINLFLEHHTVSQKLLYLFKHANFLPKTCCQNQINDTQECILLPLFEILESKECQVKLHTTLYKKDILESEKYEYFPFISLSLNNYKHKVHLYTLLSDYSQPHIINDQIKQVTDFELSGDLAIFHIERFHSNHIEIELSETYDDFHLTCIIFYDSGHYWCMAKRKEGWVLLNDMQVTIIGPHLKLTNHQQTCISSLLFEKNPQTNNLISFGLKNHGSTCYQNVGLQMIYTSAFLKSLISSKVNAYP